MRSAHPGLPALQAWAQQHREVSVAVALSAGADSMALLHAAVAVWGQRVQAIHVNHGLQDAANAFAALAQTACDGLQVPVHLVRAQASPVAGESPEAAARHARYLALASRAHACQVDVVLLAHHAQDQSETVLLALSRGAGLPGLSGMPVDGVRHGVRFARPWLGVSGVALRQWLQDESIAYAHDPTNDHVRYTRNRIRHQVLPAWRHAFAAGDDMLARTARHLAQAQQLLLELAADDWAQLGRAPRITALQALSPARQVNVLRFWLAQVHHTQASDAQMQALRKQLVACTTRGHHIMLKVGQGHVVRDAEYLSFVPAARAQGAHDAGLGDL